MVPLLNMQQGRQQQLMAKVSISVLVMALPVLYVSFLHVPPATLFRDTTFWFLMSNSIIVVIAADSGMLFFGSSYSAVVDDRPFVDVNELPLPVIENDDHAPVPFVVINGDNDAVGGTKRRALVLNPAGRQGVVVTVPDSGETVQQARARKRAAARRRRSRSYSHAVADPVQEKSMVVVEEKLRRTATEPRSEAEAERESEYTRLSDEELNRRVEDFITRFNREIRLQVQKEQA